MTEKLQVYILTSSKLNRDYLRTFTTEDGFEEPIFMKTQYPNQRWMDRFTKLMGYEESLFLFNHYLIWLKCLQENRPLVILDNCSESTQPDAVLADLILAGSEMTNVDLVYYGKYLDRCDYYQEASTVCTKSASVTFQMYYTYSPHGTHAYLLQPSGARKLIDRLSTGAGTVDEMLNQMVEQGKLRAVTYSPSIIRDSEETLECREPEPLTWSWTRAAWGLLILVIILFIIGFTLYSFLSNLTYDSLDEISTGFSVPTYKGQDKFVDSFNAQSRLDSV